MKALSLFRAPEVSSEGVLLNDLLIVSKGTEVQKIRRMEGKLILFRVQSGENKGKYFIWPSRNLSRYFEPKETQPAQ